MRLGKLGPPSPCSAIILHKVSFTTPHGRHEPGPPFPVRGPGMRLVVATEVVSRLHTQFERILIDEVASFRGKFEIPSTLCHGSNHGSRLTLPLPYGGSLTPCRC